MLKVCERSEFSSLGGCSDQDCAKFSTWWNVAH